MAVQSLFESDLVIARIHAREDVERARTHIALGL
ncbi:hypothetical protein HRbin10_00882 [bacterium HR10]|nr:hypothetical protein HRbin10_00882 [bacterium HR10]